MFKIMHRHSKSDRLQTILKSDENAEGGTLDSARPILSWKIPTWESGWGMVRKNNFVTVTVEKW